MNKSKKEYTYKTGKTGSSNRVLTINEKVDSLSDAKIKAVARLKEANREAETMTLTVAAAGKELYSSGCITLKNASEMSGKWFIDKITHKITGSGGYTIDMELHRVPAAKSTKKTSKKSTAKKKTVSRPTLKYGSKGKWVLTLQKKLRSFGLYKNGALDGSFGPITRTAVKQFQRKHGLKADGIVGAKTWAALYK